MTVRDRLSASASSVLMVARTLMEVSGALEEITSSMPEGEAKAAARKRVESVGERISELLDRLEKDLQ